MLHDILPCCYHLLSSVVPPHEIYDALNQIYCLTVSNAMAIDCEKISCSHTLPGLGYLKYDYSTIIGSFWCSIFREMLIFTSQLTCKLMSLNNWEHFHFSVITSTAGVTFSGISRPNMTAPLPSLPCHIITVIERNIALIFLIAIFFISY